MIEPKKIPEALLDAFERHSHMVIIGHKSPDSDSLNSQYALSSLLQRQGKRTQLVSAGPFTRTEIVSYQKDFDEHISDEFKRASALVVVVDCSSVDRIGYLGDELEGLEVAVIDHHASGEPFGDVRYIDEKAFSVTYLILQLYTHYGVIPNEWEASCMLFGLATDTGFFRHIGSRRSEVLLAAAELNEAGASMRDIHGKMFGSKTFESRKLLGLLLQRMESLLEGKLLITYETYEETLHYGELNRDSETLYSQMQSVTGSQIILYIRQDEGPNSCTVGFRAQGDCPVDVGKAAAVFGGGGHRKAAGATIAGSIDEVREMLIQTVTPLLEKVQHV